MNKTENDNETRVEDYQKRENEEDPFENYFKIISFKDRIKSEKTTLDNIKNFILRFITVIIFYYFASKYSGYLLFLNPVKDGVAVQNFQYLSGFLILVLLSHYFGSSISVLGAFCGDIMYQMATNGTILWEYTIGVIILAFCTGIIKYNKETSIPKLKILKFFYTLVLGVIASVAAIYLYVRLFYPLIDLSSTVGEIFTRNLAQIFISEIISVLFIAPIIIVVLDRLMLKASNKFGNIYTMILTHHTEFESDHAVPVNLGGYNVFICTRCTGMVSGIIIGLFVQSLLFLIFSIDISSDTAFWIALLTPIPGIIDWGSQKLGFRTSNDVIRIITGLFVGFALHAISIMESMSWRVLILVMSYFTLFGTLMAIGDRIAYKRSLRKNNPDESNEESNNFEE